MRSHTVGMLMAAMLVGTAGAGISSYDLFAINYHWQYSAGGPTASYAHTFTTRVITTNPVDIGSASTVHTTSVTPPMMMSDRGSEWTYVSPVYSTAAERNSKFPIGLYAFNISGGTLGTATGYRSFPSHANFAGAPPYFQNLTALRAVDVRQETQIIPSAFTVPTGVIGRTYLAIFDGTGELVAKGDSDPNAGAFLLPTGLLRPNHQYTVSLYFSTRMHTEAAGFNGASSDAGWDTITSTYLTTIQVCGTADYNGDGDFGTAQDIEAFFACLAGVCCDSCWVGGGDFNGDGDSGTDQDIEAFFRVLSGAGC